MNSSLKVARLLSGKTQGDLAKETGIHFSSISRIERGISQPSEQQKLLLVESLGFPMDFIFPLEEAKEPGKD